MKKFVIKTFLLTFQPLLMYKKTYVTRFLIEKNIF